MEQTPRWTHADRPDGFALTELLVVLTVIATLIAIVVPTYFSARVRADNKAAQSSLRDALVAAKTLYSDSNSFAGADDSATGLRTVEPSLTYVSHVTDSSGPKSVSVHATQSAWSAAVKSAGGSCFWISDTGGGAVRYGGVENASSCTGDDADAAMSPQFP
jgi:type IV pilus assembly protein PilA